MIINKIQEFCMYSFQINHLVVYSKKNILKTFNSEFQAPEVWFSDQIEIEYM